MDLDRRELFGALAFGGVALPLHHTPQDPAARPGRHEPKPLPFDPKGLRGLSEKLLVSHHQNNYGGAVRNLVKVEAELANVTKDTPPFVVAGLRERELTFRNSATLHEQYFANLGGDGKLGPALGEATAAAFGSAARFEEAFRAAALSLAGGSGWVVLGWDLLRDGLALHWSGNHTQIGAASLPLLVLDMYEHAFHIDYGAAAGKYVEAFFANVHGGEVDRRLQCARKAAAALRA